MSAIVKPFVTKYMNAGDFKCKGCKSRICAENLVIGSVADRGPERSKRCSTDWYHYRCFWTLCPYKNQLRGVDSETLNEIVYGIGTLTKADKFTFQNEASCPPVLNRRQSASSSSKSGVLPLKDLGSVDGGDYELDPNTFDLTDYVCVSVFKHQTNVFVSIRRFFKVKPSNIAKPSKIGISLTKDQWRELIKIQNGITAATKIMAIKGTEKTSKKSKKKEDDKNKDRKEDNEEEDDDDDTPGQILFSLSWKRRVSVFACDEEAVVDIREYTEDKTFKRSTKGVALAVAQWTKLREEMPNIDSLVQRLDS